MEKTIDVNDIIFRLQQFVYPRRPRIKEQFVDYDPLRGGAVSYTRFVRAVASLGCPAVSTDEIEILAHHFSRQNADVDYIKFCAAVDEVFGPLTTSKDPTVEIHQSGHSVPPQFVPGTVDDEEKLHAVMHRMSLVAKTRGIVFKYCFEDLDRSDSVSLLVPRRSGKCTKETFIRSFPFKGEISNDEMNMLIQRYGTTADTNASLTIVNYLALHDDITDRAGAVAQEELPTSNYVARDLSQVHWTHEETSAVERVQARVVERRLRPRDYFQDFDPLRKGYCTKGQARTVFSTMDLKLSEKDFESLCKLYCRVGDEMFHYDAFQSKVDSAFAASDLELHPTAQTQLPGPEDTLAARTNTVKGGFVCAANIGHSHPLYKLTDPEAVGYVELLEAKVKEFVKEMRLPMKKFFREYDTTAQGHVTQSQFFRVLSTLHIPVQLEDMSLIAAKYSDRGNLRDINYKLFCESVDPVDPDIIVAATEEVAAYSRAEKANYFDKGGQVIPAM